MQKRQGINVVRPVQASGPLRVEHDRTAPRVLLLTSTLGSGHLRAAQAVEAALLERSPTPIVQTIDFWSLMDAGVAQTVRQTYLRLVQERPELYDRIYQLDERTWRDILESNEAPPPALAEGLELLAATGAEDARLEPSGGHYALDRVQSYPVSGNVKTYSAPGYVTDHPIVPHGMSVILNAPAVFRFTARANPARHLQAAEALGADVSGAKAEDAGKILADRIIWFMQRLKMPNGLKAIGYSSSDIPALVEGTLPQHRVTKLSPRPAGPDELSALFEDSMVAW